MRKNITIALDADLHRRLKFIATDCNLTMSALVISVLAEFFDPSVPHEFLPPEAVSGLFTAQPAYPPTPRTILCTRGWLKADGLMAEGCLPPHPPHNPVQQVVAESGRLMAEGCLPPTGESRVARGSGRRGL